MISLFEGSPAATVNGLSLYTRDGDRRVYCEQGHHVCDCNPRKLLLSHLRGGNWDDAFSNWQDRDDVPAAGDEWPVCPCSAEIVWPSIRGATF